MKATFALWIWIALAVPIAAVAIDESAASAPSDRTSGSADLKALEQLLLGEWRGPACGGNFNFNADGSFNLTSYTPGGNTLTGQWRIRWDALPPTLVLKCTTSDFTTKAPGRDEFEFLGNNWELKLLELDDDTLVLRQPNFKGRELPDEKRQQKFTRPESIERQ